MRIDIEELEQSIQKDLINDDDVEAANYLLRVVDELKDLREIVGLVEKFNKDDHWVDEIKLTKAVEKYLEKHNDAI